MSVHSIKTVQKIPCSLTTAWDFFSDPANLAKITPGNLNFKVISKYHGNKIYPGQIIEYTVKPILKIPLHWMTEITHVEKEKYFIDEQRKGPYNLWYHQHHFKTIEGGIEMTDIVHYKIPFGFIGEFANSIFVKSQLRKIFEYRFQKVEEVFDKWKGQAFEAETH